MVVAALGGRKYVDDVSIVGHQALAKTTLTCKPPDGETGIKSTRIVLTMEHEQKDILFYRQLIPYEKIWKAN